MSGPHIYAYVAMLNHIRLLFHFVLEAASPLCCAGPHVVQADALRLFLSPIGPCDCDHHNALAAKQQLLYASLLRFLPNARG